jgi:hypothetical protein
VTGIAGYGAEELADLVHEARFERALVGGLPVFREIADRALCEVVALMERPAAALKVVWELFGLFPGYFHYWEEPEYAWMEGMFHGLPPAKRAGLLKALDGPNYVHFGRRPSESMTIKAVVDGIQNLAVQLDPLVREQKHTSPNKKRAAMSREEATELVALGRERMGRARGDDEYADSVLAVRIAVDRENRRLRARQEGLRVPKREVPTGGIPKADVIPESSVCQKACRADFCDNCHAFSMPGDVHHCREAMHVAELVGPHAHCAVCGRVTLFKLTPVRFAGYETRRFYGHPSPAVFAQWRTHRPTGMRQFLGFACEVVRGDPNGCAAKLDSRVPRPQHWPPEPVVVSGASALPRGASKRTGKPPARSRRRGNGSP